ncbi:DNA internalization-related competence protein ComEC/Rec2 [Polynucleobacter paneuropaeus]|nr:DNA internalization-related competence protein ComEC/Rec2 [Polynucleobacter paneuropaeus]
MPANYFAVTLVLITLLLPAIFYIGHPQIKSVLVMIMTFTVGFCWNAHYADQRLDHVLPNSLDGAEFELIGRVDALPQGNSQGSRFAFEVEKSTSRENTEVFTPRIYLSWNPTWKNTNTIPEIIPGQRWNFKVKLKQPYGLLNPHTFDFERWAFQQDYGATGSVRSGELLETNAIGWFDFRLGMERKRWQLREKIQRLLPKDARYQGVLVALVLGDQNAIEQDDWRIFNATGIGHLISISGLHVTMLAGVGAVIAAKVWRRRSLPLYIPVAKVAAIIGFLTAFIYTWLAGFQIPAQRTMYMVGVVAFALWNGRNPRSFDIWWWALFFALLIDPMAPYTPGFWLSFGAVAAILYSMKDSKGLLGIPTGKELETIWQDRIRMALSEASRVQAVVTIALLPLTYYWFYQTSIVSPIANTLAIPVVSYVVTPFAIAGALLPEWLGEWFLKLAHLSMEYLGIALTKFAGLSWAVHRSHEPTIWALSITSLGVIMAIRPGDLLDSWKSRVCGVCLSSVLFIPPLPHLKPGQFRATVLDIGQGTAVLIETATKTLLYDTGPTHGMKDDAGRRVIIPFLLGSGIHEIDRLVISHSDSDHIGGAASLLKEIRFRSMMGSLPENNPLLSNLNRRSIPALPCRYGQQWEWDIVTFKVWHPDEYTNFDLEYPMKPNEMSCVLEISNDRYSFWMTGDVEKYGEAEIVSRLVNEEYSKNNYKEVIFMAPHHGSKTSSSVGLLEALNPSQAFAQNGHLNRYGHPHPAVTQRYQDLNVPFYQTPKTGAQIWDFKSHGFSKIDWRHREKRIWHRK